MNELANIKSDDGQLRELALFAGAGGGILGGKLLGWRTVCAVELEPYAASALVARQNDGILQTFPIWDDVCTFDGKPWRGLVDVVSGGFPCQDISAAGKGAGITGKRSGLWGQMARIIGEVRPRHVFVENSPALTSRGLGTVLGDLAAMGFDARWGVLGAVHAGAPHKRERIWIVGNSRSDRRNQGRNDNREHDGTIVASDGQHSGTMADTNSEHVYDPGFRASEVSQQQEAAVLGMLPHPNSQRQQEQHVTGVTAKQGRISGGPHERRSAQWWATEPDVC